MTGKEVHGKHIRLGSLSPDETEVDYFVATDMKDGPGPSEPGLGLGLLVASFDATSFLCCHHGLGMASCAYCISFNGGSFPHPRVGVVHDCVVY